MLQQIQLTVPEQAIIVTGTLVYDKVRIMKITWSTGTLSALVEVGRVVGDKWEMFRDFTKRYTTPARTGTREYGATVYGAKALSKLETDILNHAQADNEVGAGNVVAI